MKPLDGLRILVVDDEQDALDLLCFVLSDAGARPTCVDNAEEALQAVTSDGYDVVLSDLSMPARDGYWLIEQLRSLPPDRGGLVPAAAITAHHSGGTRQRVLRSGFQLHIAKPVVPRELVQAVQVLVRH